MIIIIINIIFSIIYSFAEKLNLSLIYHSCTMR